MLMWSIVQFKWSFHKGALRVFQPRFSPAVGLKRVDNLDTRRTNGALPFLLLHNFQQSVALFLLDKQRTGFPLKSPLTSLRIHFGTDVLHLES